ncbi:hypothetical protein EVAR_44771_1 [Eumeta japonica]|uniref:Uncharacterized protein n=1 Tax=Eumeta variegata TaxID=151549 RepID=A0A4C1YAA6_EUMVA|nr:hypothetical protein EVAR_44771_1 [Eumeta japonica]
MSGGGRVVNASPSIYEVPGSNSDYGRIDQRVLNLYQINQVVLCVGDSIKSLVQDIITAHVIKRKVQYPLTWRVRGQQRTGPPLRSVGGEHDVADARVTRAGTIRLFRATQSTAVWHEARGPLAPSAVVACPPIIDIHQAETKRIWGGATGRTSRQISHELATSVFGQRARRPPGPAGGSS